MKKDKEWLKDKVFELYPMYGEMYVSPDYETATKTETISKVLALINQLDEQETLSQQWIDENSKEMTLEEIEAELGYKIKLREGGE